MLSPSLDSACIAFGDSLNTYTEDEVLDFPWDDVVIIDDIPYLPEGEDEDLFLALCENPY
jgi:hypothetical protein